MVTTSSGNEQHGTWNRPLPTPDHSVEITVGSDVSDEYFLLVRAASSGGAATSYVQTRLYTNDGSVELNSKVEGGDFTRRASLNSGPPLVTGQVISFEAVGTEYILRVDGVEILRWSDTAVAWPYVDDLHRNVDVGMQSAGVGSFDNFKATDLTGVTPPTVAEFSGDGTLSAVVSKTLLPMSNFDFHEGSGPRADATIGAYNLIPDDPAAAWNGEKATGTFRGVVGAGRQSEWSVALWMTYTSLTYAPYDIEVGSASKIGLNCSNNPPGVFPGLWTAGGWVYSTTPVGTWDNPFLLVCVNSVADGIQTLYLNGVSVLETPTPVERDFDVSGDLTLTYPGNTLTVDNLAYWDAALTPAEVAALPPAPPVLPPLPPPVAGKLSGEGTLSATAFPPVPPVPQPYADDFNRPDGPPGGTWEIISDTGTDLVISSGELAVVGNDALESRHALWVRPLPGNDHKIEVRIGSDVASSISLMVRLNKDDGHLRAVFNPDGSSSGVSFMPFEGGLMTGGGTTGGGGPTPPLVTGTVLGFEAVGPDYIAYVDGVEVARTAPAWNHIDEAHRQVGVMIQSLPVVYGGNDKASLDDFVATDLMPVVPYDPDDYSDTFQRADGAPGGNWGVWHTGAATEDLAIVGNELVSTAITDEQHAWWAKSLPGDDHRVEITVGSTVPYQYYLLVRASVDNGDVRAIVESTGVAVIMTKETRDAPTGTIRAEIPVGSGTPLATGQKVSFEAVGQNYIVCVDGVEILRWQDLTRAWAHVGIDNRSVDVGMLSAAADVGAIDNFQATDLGFSDSFNRPDGDPGPNWVLSTSGTDNLVIAGNALASSAAGEDQYGLWVRPVPNNDQKVQVVVGATVPPTTKLILRHGDAGHVFGDIHSDGRPEIYTVVGDLMTGVPTLQAVSAELIALAPGQWLSFEAIGTGYVFKVDGLAVLSWPDTLNEFPHTSHRDVGVMLNGLGSLDDFEASDPSIYPHGEFGGDGFQQPDGSTPGPDWEITYEWPDATTLCTIQDGSLHHTGQGSSVCRWVHPTPSSDQRVEVTVGKDLPDYYRIQLRGNPADPGRRIQVQHSPTLPVGLPPDLIEYFGPNIVTKSSPNDGGVARAQAPYEEDLKPGDRLAFQVVGSTYTYTVNGVQKLTYTGGEQPTNDPAWRTVCVEIQGNPPAGNPTGTLDDFLLTDLSTTAEDPAGRHRAQDTP